MKIQSPPYSPFFAACKAIVFVLLAAVTVYAPGAAAATFCVASTIALDAALAHFENEDEDTTIRLVRGAYFIQGATVHGGSADLTIIGGYDDASCQSRALDPALTVLRPNQSDAMELQAKNLQLESVTVRDVARSVFFVAYGTTFSNGRLTLGRVRFEGPATAGNVMLGEEVFISQVHVEHSGAASPGFGSCALTVDGMDDDDDRVVIQHSTIVDSPNKGLCVNPQIGTEDLGFFVYLDNNVIYGSPLDVEIGDTSKWAVRNNMYAGFATELGASVPGASGNNLVANPLFVNPGAGDYRLQPASPAVNSGRAAPQGGLPSYDVAGGLRWVGTAPDRGAYESSFDDAQPLVVTSTADTTATGTLRWALNQANASPGYSVVRFNIPGACPRVIVANENLPAIVTPVGIDGYSQPGAHPNTQTGGLFGQSTNAAICVLVTSTGANWGLRVPLGASNGQLGVSGIAIGGFAQAAISIEAGSGSSIVGNEIRAPQPIGIFVSGTATGTQIGGPDPWQTNVIRSDDGYGIALNPPSTGARVENNLVGIEASGNGVTVGNAIGIGVSASDNTIVDNAIAGSSSIGVQITGSRNLVRSNVLGRKVGFQFCPIGTPCDADLANGSHGVLIQGDATGNVIEGNIIANSGGHGICATSGQRNLFLSNRIWNSGQLGIDLGDNGNDAANDDTAPAEQGKPNRGINPPIATSARGGARSGTVRGRLQTINGRYVLQAFMSNGCAHGGQGEWLAGLAVVDVVNGTAASNGTVLFDVPLRSVNPRPSLIGRSITVSATQIDANGYGHSSEMSTCTTYSDDTIFKDGFE